MGPGIFMQARLLPMLAGTHQLTHVSRVESGSPAAGSKEVSDLEKADLLARSLA